MKRPDWKTIAVLATLTCFATGCPKKSGPAKEPTKTEQPAKNSAKVAPKKGGAGKVKKAQVIAADVAQRLAQFSPTDVDFDEKLVSPANRKVLKKLVEAGKIMDEIFLIQVDRDNPKRRAAMVADKVPQAAIDYFDIMYGPWDRLKGDHPFAGNQEKPKGAGYYPADMTKAEFEAWVKAHPKDEKAFRGYFTLIERDGKGLRAVPYSKAYETQLKKASKLLKEAAAEAKHPALKKYLEQRAAAFLSNEYRESDMAWMDLGDSPIEVVIGPYEVYEDKLMGYKAAFESFITLRDPVYSAKLQKLTTFNAALEKNLPIDKKYLTKRGLSSPISVVIEVYTSGDTRAAVQTAAFNLPNDEEVRAKKGSKKVMLKNVIEAKYNKVLVPIANKLVDPALVKQLDFDAYFTDILLHELAHGMGPGKITVNGKKTDVNKALKELYPSIEECKADIAGLVNGFYLAKKGGLDKSMATKLPAAYVAGVFRAVRFGTEEAHAKAVLLAFNYLREKGAVTYDAKTERFGANLKTFEAGVRALAADLMMLQAKGDYAGAKAMLTKYGTVSPEMKKALDKVKDVPVDIKPNYTILTKMKSW